MKSRHNEKNVIGLFKPARYWGPWKGYSNTLSEALKLKGRLLLNALDWQITFYLPFFGNGKNYLTVEGGWKTILLRSD